MTSIGAIFTRVQVTKIYRGWWGLASAAGYKQCNGQELAGLKLFILCMYLKLYPIKAVFQRHYFTV